MSRKMQPLNESVVIRSLRRFRDIYLTPRRGGGGRESSGTTAGGEPGTDDSQPGLLDSLPVDLQFLIMSLLSPEDICRLGATSCYWRAMVRDPLLWRYFLLRDMPTWSSIDHLSMPHLDGLNAPIINEAEGDEGEDRGTEVKCDYMSEYLRGCPSCRHQWLPSRPAYQVLTSFLQSLVPSSEPRYAMFGPGMEQLDVSIVTRLMFAPDVLPVSGTPQRQINGIGSGISYLLNNKHRFNILTLYSANRADRERARLEQQSVTNKLFTIDGEDEAGCPVYIPAPQVQQVCQVVDGFIYVANAEPGRDGGRCEVAQIQAVLNSAGGSTPRPLLVLSCISREEPEAAGATRPQGDASGGRTPSVEMAKRLGLPQLTNPWMVQDTVAESLSGLLDGVSWLLRCSGVKLHSS